MAHQPKQGQRLDAFVAQWLSLSRHEVRTLLSLDAIVVNGKSCGSKGYLLRPSDQVEVLPDAIAKRNQIEPNPQLKIPLLYKDPTLVVVDKPAGVAVHPLHPGQTQTVLNGLITLFPQLGRATQENISSIASSNISERTSEEELPGAVSQTKGKLPGELPGAGGVGEGGLRSGVVHRLDVDTSGALAIALTEASWKRWRAAFSEHQVTKLYHALVVGHPAAAGKAALSLRITQHRPAKVRVVEKSEGYLCDLSWRVLETYEQASLVEVNLGTGFLHQIRVMFAHLGHPVLGDSLYACELADLKVTSGVVLPLPEAPRQMLHAAMLALDGLEIHCPVPADFEQVCEALRG